MAPWPASVSGDCLPRANYETIRDPFEIIFPTNENTWKRVAAIDAAAIPIMEIAVNAISYVLSHPIQDTSTEARPLRSIAMFCSVGLVASLGLATLGIDLSAY